MPTLPAALDDLEFQLRFNIFKHLLHISNPKAEQDLLARGHSNAKLPQLVTRGCFEANMPKLDTRGHSRGNLPKLVTRCCFQVNLPKLVTRGHS